ncbi:MAG: protein-L-isoaspartate(D-aspartate) O-methyltransferase [Parcubacteria group bacterium Gr01-1014_72]|nr:MAG: protein-L-isoaspartate(D-aspartate) O-methyltransferase [Parcubacteria group bacterium Gr01-1014_72]
MNREEFLKHLKHGTRVLRGVRLEEAFRVVDRKDFVASDYESEAYEDYPLFIGEGQTISQPTTVAFMLELLNVQLNERVLDVGAGSGWTTALLAKLVGEKGEVWGIEIRPELLTFGQKNLKKYGFKNAYIVPALPQVVGLPDKAPFKRILVSAAAHKIPEKLIEQLAVNGTMVIPVGDSVQNLTSIEKLSDGELLTREYPGFAFVPFVR